MFLKLLILTLIVWWSGLFGTELYILPLLILVIYTVIKIRKKQLNQSLIDSQNRVYDFFSSLDEKYIYLFIVIQFLIWCLIHFFRYYSFNINTWDAGLHSNILFNISNLDFYSSFLNVNNLGDHFTPLFSIIAIFYAIEPSIHWLMIAKSLSYFFSTLYLYKIVRFHIKGKYSVATAFLFIFGWTYLYSPIIASYKYEFQASALAPPFILYGFYNYHKGKKVLFWLAMFALLGIKEHLGAVWIGFGLYLFCSDPSKKKVESSI
ncbi:MAG: putative membrane protein, partial [bacterium]